MDQGPEGYWLRRRNPPLCPRPGRSNTVRPDLSQLDPWIVNLLLEYKESVIKTDGQIGRVLKLLNKPRDYQDAEQEPETILIIGDGLHYIEAVVTGKAAKMTKESMARSGLPGIIDQFISLQNYRVNFKRATDMKDCRFYLTLECFQVVAMKRAGGKKQTCNRELSVIQKIKELWQKSFATQRWFNSGQESQKAPQALKDMNHDQVNKLKQNAKECLNLLGTSKLLNSKKLAMYADTTRWQLERKHSKMHRDVFRVPAEYLVISAENEAALSESYMLNTPQAVPEEDKNLQEDDHSPVSFFSDCASLDESLENPWDAVTGITLSPSTDSSGASCGLPETQQLLLASPAEEANPASNACISHLLEPCDNTPCHRSEPTTPPPKQFWSLFHFQNSEFLIETANPKPDLVMPTTSGQPSQLADSLPCGQPLNKSPLHNSGLPFSYVRHSNQGDFSLEPVSDNRKGCLSLAHNVKVPTARSKYFEMEKDVSAQRKRGPNEEGPSKTSIPSCSGNNLEGIGHCSTETVTKNSTPNKRHINRYFALKFSSIPKKRRLEEVLDKQSHVSARCSCTESHLEKRSEQEPTGIVTMQSKQIGVQEKDEKGDSFHVLRNPPTPELCSQVPSVRISGALLKWARWVFSNAEKQ